ncbi:carbamoyl-phosphate synthase small subunit [Gracilibacillus halotolerans]|uniref:Carbamoyl phosphate synthase small chain n=1 Tax=Gracilibacillus halotolerans TaxID=74386 RepID=A0A841RBU6_9BACI|nr:carbamoyl phosphate synthase small subunit [Gracilibacillus halotolerans]MBB6511380.1 carbamoyl-phosphate synthase small subunit [Gracilibacillus halotolerans]
MKRLLVLEDGTTFVGEAFGSEQEKIGEVVFTTGMTGYQEVLSNPANCGLMVVMTYPVIGSYGINRDDFESINPCLFGVIVKEFSQAPSNFRSDEDIDTFLTANNIPGISGIDTRKLTRHIRTKGAMRGILSRAGDTDKEALLDKLKSEPPIRNQVEMVSTAKPYVVPGRGKRVVLIDYGVKHGILRELTKRNCHVTVVPYNYSAESILRLQPDGILLSNGPGNPKDVEGAQSTIQAIMKKAPIFAVGLGHQLFALASGADTEKMLFGHHGGNQPVYDTETKRAYLTSQNHGYVVNKESVVHTDLEITQYALNDKTIEGLRHLQLPALSVQYYPEGAPGPDETTFLFDRFMELMQTSKAVKEEV